jgi:integrase/recombinase XerD
LHEKGGKRHEMPAHHVLDQYLEEYRGAAGLASDPKGFLFRTAKGRSGRLTDEPMAQPDAYRMIRRRAVACGLKTKIGNHSFGLQGLQSTCATVGSWRLRSRWPRMSPQARRGFMTAERTM